MVSIGVLTEEQSQLAPPADGQKITQVLRCGSIWARRFSSLRSFSLSLSTDTYAVKEEPINISLKCGNPDEDMGQSTKRRRMAMVGVPTLQEVNQNRAAKLGHKQAANVPQVRLRRDI